MTKVIDENGGTLETADGKAKLIVPARAVASAVTFSITTRDAADYQNTTELVSEIYQLGPANTTFDHPVVFSLAHTGTPPTGKRGVVLHYDTSSSTWEPLEQSMTADGRIVGLLEHFSSFSGGYVTGDLGSPITNVILYPATLMNPQPAETWYRRWQTDSRTVTIEGNTTPDGMGSWADKNSGQSGTFSITNSHFKFQYTLPALNFAYPVLTNARQSVYWLEIWCGAGCGTVIPDAGPGDGPAVDSTAVDGMTPDGPTSPQTNVEWSWLFSGPGYSETNSVAVDPSGNVWMCGEAQYTIDFGGGTVDALSSTDAFVAKYDTNGTYLYGKLFDQSTNGSKCKGIATDSSGNVFITGTGTVDFGGGPTTPHAGGFYLVKLSSGGAHLWSKAFGTGEAGAVTVDSAGNVIMVGTSMGTSHDFGGGPETNTGGTNAVVLKYSNDGAYIWSKRHDFSDVQRAFGVSTDSANTIYVTGTFVGTVTFGGSTALNSQGDADIFLLKLAANGDYLWSKSFGGSDPDAAYAVVADKDNNVFLSGTTGFPTPYMFFAKYDGSTGNELWKKPIQQDVVGRALATDATGNVFFAGYFRGNRNLGGGAFTNQGDSDAFVAKYDTSGTHLFSEPYGSHGQQEATGVAMDSAGNIFVGGWTICAWIDFGKGQQTGSTTSDPFLLKTKP